MWKYNSYLRFLLPDLRYSWIIQAPGFKEHGQAIPENYYEAIIQKGTLPLEAGTFGVVLESNTWKLHAPGHREDGSVVPDKFLDAIEANQGEGFLKLPAGRFTVRRAQL